MIWFVLALLTGVAVLSLLWPLSRPAPQPRQDAADVAFYRAQIAEIDAELLRGAIDKEQAEAAKALAARRLLAAAPEENVVVVESTRTKRIAAVLAIVVIPAVALGLYGRIGRPDLPDLPRDARRATEAGMDIGAAVAKIEAHLAGHPEDGRAYELVAPVYLRMGRFDDAVSARERAIALLGDTPERRVRYAEALAFAADGVVTPEAEEQIRRALEIDPKYLEARYFLGLAAAQREDVEAARKIWSDMISELPADSPAAKAIAEKLALLDSPGQRGPMAPGAESPGGVSAPSAAAAAAVAAQPRDEQQKTIRAMVERLAQRLAAQGGGAEEWMRLIRAYKVLNEPDKAQTALADAQTALKGDAASQAKLGLLAQELGLKQ
ncbi:c-type cytochrome biogenesis protein CcmI [uncultured Rhodoblastus sp.]|uniref:c-type cytochrome biogenesis protein CcmI n=1 Tax=uncultured Rhodoblastus sp. TaxID=543037 RepID=UPI0025EEEB73|nr:c-type cytochrome biogenesis protein CcmI [uncultured Rhodoblastus sp.]